MHVEHGRAFADSGADQKGGGSHRGDKDGHSGPADTAGFEPRLRPSGLANQAIEKGEHQERRTKPHRSGLRQPFPVLHMNQPLMQEAARPPCPRQKILRERADHQHVEQRWQSEAKQSIADEGRKTLPVIGVRRKIAGDEEKHRHEEGLQDTLVHAEKDLGAKAATQTIPGAIDVIPIPERAVGVRRVHAEHQDDHRPPDVVDEQQPRRTARRGRGSCGRLQSGRQSSHTAGQRSALSEAHRPTVV